MTIPLVNVGAFLDPALAEARPELQAEVAGADSPIALLPVRLETRFFAAPDGTSELRVRVYPDKIHLDSHDPALSASEVAAGQAYWQERWGADVSAHQQAWGALSDRFGPGRAAWIARALTPTNDPPSPAVFPDLGEPSTVQRTPVARALPARWVATAYRNGTVAGVAVGRDLSGPLPVGPDLDPALAPVASEDAPSIDQGMRWMVNFDRAEEVGMALRVALPFGLADAAVNLLVVSGVADGQQEQTFANLLDSHRFTDGLEVLGPATPTNNTGDERSGWAEKDPRGVRSFAAEWGAEPTPRADLLAASLGVDAFGSVPGATGDDESTAEAMATALWPATWGYYLTQFSGLTGGGVGSTLSLDDVSWGRDHVQRFVRPGGHLPTIRAGRQPYGILPVTSLNRLDSPTDSRIGVLRRVLAGLRDGLWRPALNDVARVGASTDPSGDLVNVLRTDALPAALRVRRLMGPHYLRHLQLFLGEDLDADNFWLTLQGISSSAVARAGLEFLPAAARVVFEGATALVDAPLVGDDLGYLADLLAATDLDALVVPAAQRLPVLQALLRHGLLREHALLAARLLASDTLPLASLVQDAELVNLVSATAPTHSFGWQRNQTQPGTARTVRDALADLDSLPAAHTRSLVEFHDALGVLARSDTATLERHLLNTLAATSYRLDAWVTSLAARRLSDVRDSAPTGLLVGGYGWLEGLLPEPTTAAPAVEDEPNLVLPASDPGFIHAPSLDQAGTAALLRNAHLAHGGDADNPYAIELTSSRVRSAQRLLDGVRQGQGLGALLGYDFERSLHETHPGDDPTDPAAGTLDDLLDDFRRLAPPPDVEAEQAAARRVLLDGLVLARRWRDEPATVLAGLDNLGAEGTPRHDAVTGLLHRLDRALDAVADAVTAEGVHQLVRGNLDRASATLEDVNVGDAAPPELQHQRTPRSGLPVTHRVAVVLDADDVAPGWAAASSSVRAAADPAVNAWLGRLLGPATAVTVSLSTGHDVSLASLNLTPLDLARLSLDASGRDELALRAYLAGVPQAQRTLGIRVSLAPAAPGPRTEVTIWDLLEVASSAATLVSKARPLDGDDLQPPTAEAAPGVNLDEYDDRATAAHAALRRAREALAAAIGAPSADSLGAAMTGAADFGVAASLQDPPLPLARAVLSELDRRLTEADAAAVPVPSEPDAAWRARVVRRFAAVFGPGFVPTPRFRAPTPADLAASLADPALLGGDPLAPRTWSLRMSRLRPALAQLDLTSHESEALGNDPGDLRIAQLPHESGQRWVGLSLDGDLREGVVSLAMQGDLGHLEGRLSGLLLDEWTEVVPHSKETTGIAFRYDPPDAAPPQAILLAVPPVLGEPWTVGTLNQVLLEALDLAHLRACGPKELEAIGHYLPATALAFNVDGDAVSTDLNALTQGAT